MGRKAFRKDAHGSVFVGKRRTVKAVESPWSLSKTGARKQVRKLTKGDRSRARSKSRGR